MANFFGFSSNKENKEETKNASRIQDYINRYKIHSRDLQSSDKSKAKQDPYSWQGYSWIKEATATTNERKNRYREYKEMTKVPELNQGLNIYCLHPETIISTLKGDYTIKELADGALGKEFDVWSYNIKENRVDIGKAKDPHITLRNTDVYKVTFDNGKSIIATSNHPFLMKNKIYKELKDLIPGERVIPFNSRIKNNYQNISTIEYYGSSDVYDMEVEEFHNFNANGVFVHNSDNATQYDINNNVIKIESDNAKIVEILSELFFEKLDINANLWAYTKNMCKLGDEFLEVLVDNKSNPHHIIALERIKKPEYVEREEKKGQLQRFIYKKESVESNDINEKIFLPWQMIHFKIEDDEFDPYGRSVFESGRKTWKRLSLMEDAMLVYRISRAPERRVFYIDVGTLSTRDANEYLEQLKRKFRKKSFVNPHTGEIDEKANPLCITLNTKIPLLDGRSLELRELIKEYKDGKENWVYSIDTNNGNQIIPGKIVWADVTRKNAKLIKVTLDNGKELRTTPDHKFMLRDGSYIEAQNLIEGQALMPLYKKEDQVYEQIYNPKTNRYKYTHHLVAEKEIKKPEIKKECIHHIDYNPRNNDPNNLKVLSVKEHHEIHSYAVDKSVERRKWLWENNKEWAENTRKSISKASKKVWEKYTNKEKENILKNLQEYNYSEKHKKDVSEFNIKRNSTQAMSWYNDSDLHKEHNKIRSANLKKQFSDSELRKKYIDGMTISNKMPEKFWSLFKSIAQSTELNSQNYISFNNVIDNANNNQELISIWNEFCQDRQKNKINRNFMARAILNEYELNTTESWLSEICEVPTKNNRYVYKNHKITKIEWLEHTEDTGDITIDKYHNFATESGVFIHNSVDEDFYIAVRQESQGTRIETLPPGQNLGEIDDVKYFKDQILKTLGIPPGYLGSVEGGGVYDSKSFLSQQDIQFARTIERIQKFIVKGLEKIAIIELIFNKIDQEDLNNFKIKLTPPSNVDQLMEIEIRLQQFNLISQMKTLENFLPDEWIYKNIMGLNDREINQIKLQLQMQMQMQAQMQTMYGGEGGVSGGMAGGNIAPPMAGGPMDMGAEGGIEGGTEGGTEGGAEGLEIAGNEFVEFDGGKWLMENVEDVKNLLKYMKLYEKVHKDNNKKKVYEHKNSITRMAIKGEFRGLLSASKCSNGKITLTESKLIKKIRKNT